MFADAETSAPTAPAGELRPFVGRERELGVLRQALDELLAGRGGLVLIAGEAGIGKTRVAEAFSALARAAGASVLLGRSWEAGGAPAYWPWVQILRPLARELGDGALEAHDAAGAAHLAALLPDLAARPPAFEAPASDPDSARFALFDAVGTFLERAAAATPLVVVLEDLHAADPPSLLLLRFLTRSLTENRILVVGTFREAEGRSNPATRDPLAEIWRQGERLSLAGLGERDVARLIAARSGSRPSAAFAREVHEASQGNPFFVDEIVRLHLAEGARAGARGPNGAGFRIPAGVLEALERRLDPLPAEAHEVMSVASVAGRDFEAPVVQLVGGFASDRMARAVGVALEAEIVMRVDGAPATYRFAHVLIREALYDRLAAPDRRALHRAYGEALEELHADPEPVLAQLAYHHYEAASPESAGKAFQYARQAGAQAMAMLAYEEAAAHYARAAETAPQHLDPGERCDLVLALGEARIRAGDTDGARAAFREATEGARAGGFPERLARAALGYGSGGESWANGSVDESLVTLLEEALGAIGAEHPVLRALLLARLTDALVFARDWPRTDALSAEALELARGSGDQEALSRALSARQLAILRPETLEERLRLSSELLAIGEAAGEQSAALAEACAWQLLNLLEAGDSAGVERAARRFRIRAEKLRQPHDLWIAGVWDAMRATLDGRLDDAERLATQALTDAQGVVPLAAQVFGVQIMGIRREQDRLAEILPAVRALSDEYPLVSWRCGLVGVYTELGWEVEARSEFELLAAEDFGVPRLSFEWLPSICVVAEACAWLGDRERARVLYDRLRPFPGQLGVVSVGMYCNSAVARFLGLLATTMGRFDDAEAHFEEALAIHLRMATPLWTAHTQHDYAQMLVARSAPGDRERAVELAEAARSVAERLGMAAVARRAGELLGGIERSAAEPAAATRRAVFASEGDVWAIGNPEAPFRLKDSKGLAYIAELLRHPGAELYAADLAAGGSPAEGRGASEPDRDLERRGLGDAGELIDSRARDAYRRRIGELREELEQAESWHDGERATRVKAELDAVTRELAAAVGRGGGPRRAASSPERARTSVTKAVRSAIARVSEHDPALGQYLGMTITTGTFCSYTPAGHSPVRWTLERPS